MHARPVVQQGVRHLDQYPGAVAYQGISAHGAAMIQILQDLQALRDNVMRFSALDVYDEANAARIMLIPRIIKTLSHNLLHCHNFPWRNKSALRDARFYGQESLLPVEWANRNGPAAPQRKQMLRRGQAGERAL